MKFLPNPFSKRRFKQLDIALAILFAGWVPSILMAVVSYSILSRTLESKIVIDRQTLVQTLSQLVSYDIVRSAEIVEYYQHMPLTQRMVLPPTATPAAQAWLEETYYGHPRLDGMFLADAAGKLVASVPLDPQMIGKDFAQSDLAPARTRPRALSFRPSRPGWATTGSPRTIVAAVRDENRGDYRLHRRESSRGKDRQTHLGVPVRRGIPGPGDRPERLPAL